MPSDKKATWQSSKFKSKFTSELPNLQIDKMAVQQKGTFDETKSWWNDIEKNWLFAQWQVRQMMSWQNCKLTKWQIDKMASWQNSSSTKQQVDKMWSWWNNTLTQEQVDKMSNWWNVK